MSKKCQKRPLSKNKDTKAVRFLKKINKGMTCTQTATKSISLFNAYERFKIPTPVHSLHFTNSPILMFLILGLKFKLKSKL